MAKKKKIYFCDECGFESVQWLGKCPHCHVWNCFKEMNISSSAGEKKHKAASPVATKNRIQALSAIALEGQTRISLGNAEFDRVLGGGVMPHATILFTGEPGIGKSTLLLQTCAAVAEQTKQKVVYITAEESLGQVRARSLRLGITTDLIYVLAESNYDEMYQHLIDLQPALVIVDSVQAIFDPSIPSSPGTVTQVREVAFHFNQLAKEIGFVLFLIGHVTKDGVLAGPRTLEHMVDVVVYFEGDRYQSLRMIRTIKNRYGETGEVGIFEMQEKGLVAITNPSSIFLPDSETETPGRSTVALMEGRRPFLVEVQALTNKTSYNNPVRRALGVDGNKLSLLLAVIERSLKLNLSSCDVFVKAVGGLTLSESACDLAIAVAIISSFTGICLPPQVVVVGELGLGGEVRKVPLLTGRIKEAARLGFTQLIGPVATEKTPAQKGMVVQQVRTLHEIFERYFSGKQERQVAHAD